MATIGLTRRSILGAAAAATAVSAPFVRGAFAAGKLKVGFWDHWVPGANEVLAKLCNEWAAKEKVDLTLDFITSQGDKLLITIAAEREARSGHDILAMANWNSRDKAEDLEPVDDLIKSLIADNGPMPELVTFLGREDGHWVTTPTCVGSQAKPPCARIDLMKQFAGIDITQMYPADAPANKELADTWTWDFFLQAAEQCFKGGYPFGMPLGTTSDSYDWVSAVHTAYGGTMVNEQGEVTVKSDATREVLAWFQKIVPFLSPDVFAWDDAGNNKWLIAGKGALIMNPPSAWAVAKRDAPQVAEQLWTFPSPKGPKGRYDPYSAAFWSIWKFSANKSAAKSLLAYLSRRSAISELVAVSQGYDIPPYDNLRDFPTWSEQGPPKGTVYNYPPRGDVMLSLTGAPAPPKIAMQIMAQSTITKMVAQCTHQGQSIDQAMDWATSELEGFMRS
jgi:ABC-type glycerol-3-phosphate transport system substrate-binding protein